MANAYLKDLWPRWLVPSISPSWLMYAHISDLLNVKNCFNHSAHTRLVTLQVQLAPVLLKSLSHWLWLRLLMLGSCDKECGADTLQYLPFLLHWSALSLRFWSIQPQNGGWLNLVICYFVVCSLKEIFILEKGQKDAALINQPLSRCSDPSLASLTHLFNGPL